ncbi:MAG: NAD(P)H-binding protein [Kibdelosporangium sp.]
MRILVTGATGNIGRHVVSRLRTTGHEVLAMTRNPGKPGDVHGDFGKPETWPDVLDGVDRVHLFPWTTREFIEQAARAGVRRFVVHSAAAADFDIEDETTPLGAHLAAERDAHRAIELMVEATGAEWTHVRPGLLAVNALAWAGPIQAGEVIREPYPTSGYPLVHEADVAEIAVRALLADEHVGQAYTITGPAKVTQVEQINEISRAIGRPIAFEEIGPDQWPGSDWLLGLLADAVDGTGMLPPTDTFQQITGRPARTFAQWADDHAPDFTGGRMVVS